MAKKKTSTKKQITIHSNETKVLVGLLTLVGGVAVAISPFAQGEVFGQITRLAGDGSIVWGLLIVFISMRILFNKPYFNSWKPLIALTLFAFIVPAFLAFIVPDSELRRLAAENQYAQIGGVLGYTVHIELYQLIGGLIEFLLLLLTSIISFSLLSGVSLEQMKDSLEGSVDGVSTALSKMKGKELDQELDQDIDIQGAYHKADGKLGEDQQIPRQYIGRDAQERGEHELEINDALAPKMASSVTMLDGDKTTEHRASYVGDDEHGNPRQAEKKTDQDPFSEPKFLNWEFPSTTIFQEPVITPQDEKIHKRNAIVIEKTLRSFGIETRISKITIGPTVVQYALSITVGTKVTKIKNLSTDLALALATSESLVRIEAPIPGTSLIGIEIPNPTPNFVYIREMADELRKKLDKFRLPLLLGRNVAGEPIIQELTTLPHLLVAGATGSGKSAGINSILTGLLMSKTPDDLKLILVDPKMVEMAPYNGIPYLLTPVITDMELVVNALEWSIQEMLRRYRVLKQVGVKNISEYNKKIGYTGMPYIVIIIDEMADLMLSQGIEVEKRIVRLAQMARAVGMHLILATQRPSVDVITGLIKANVPGRMAFAVSASIDSRVIIDSTGAEALIGKGDMLFRSPESGKPLRIQGAFTATADTDNLVEFIKQQITEEDIVYQDAVVEAPPSNEAPKPPTSEYSEDPIFEEAVRIVVRTQKASASMLQRFLKVGYNRGARLIDEMEEARIIGPAQGSTPRRVLISDADKFFGKQSANPQDIDYSQDFDDEPIE